MLSLKYTEKEFIVSFEYDIDIINKIRNINGRKWHPMIKAWSVPRTYENYDLLLSIFPSIEVPDEITIWRQKAIIVSNENALLTDFKIYDYIPEDYIFKTKPMDHQLKAFNRYKTRNVGAILGDVGVGKTKIILDLIQYKIIKEGITKILYIAPISVLKEVMEQYSIHCNANIIRPCLLLGSMQSRLKKLDESYFNMYLLNYEMVHPMLRSLIDYNFDMCIADESSKLKHHTSQVSHAMAKLQRSVPRRYIMTGAPITQNIIDIYSQFLFLEPNIFGTNFYAFRNTYCILGGFQGKQIVGYKYKDKIKEKVYDIAMRIRKEDCVALPPKTYIKKIVEITPEQKDWYKRIAKEIVVEYESKKISQGNILTKCMKLHEIANGFLYTDTKEVIQIKSKKLNVLDELLDEILPNKVIIWVNFTSNLNMIKKLCDDKKVNYTYIESSMKPEEKHASKTKFQTDDECKILVTSPKMSGLGLNITAATYAIYFSNSENYEDRLQSEGRIYRIGQSKPVTYIDLVTEKSIEEKIITLLKFKEETSKIIEITADEILQHLKEVI